MELAEYRTVLNWNLALNLFALGRGRGSIATTIDCILPAVVRVLRALILTSFPIFNPRFETLKLPSGHIICVITNFGELPGFDFSSILAQCGHDDGREVLVLLQKFGHEPVKYTKGIILDKDLT